MMVLGNTNDDVLGNTNDVLGKQMVIEMICFVIQNDVLGNTNDVLGNTNDVLGNTK